MDISAVHETPDILTAHATIDGQRYEFTAWRGGVFEVYDYPKARQGVALRVGPHHAQLQRRQQRLPKGPKVKARADAGEPRARAPSVLGPGHC